MASTDKTPKLGLNQWAAGDRVLRTDFNEDNGKIEAGIEATKALVEANKAAIAAAHALAAGKVQMMYGDYVGDGISHRVITFGVRPLLVIMQGKSQSVNALFLVARSWTSIFGHGNPGRNSTVQVFDNSGIYPSLLANGIDLGEASLSNEIGTPHEYIVFY